MSVSFKYWEDCVDPKDIKAMWLDPDVSNEWINAGESREQKVHLSRDPDGQAFLTQTEMKVVAGTIIHRHFISQMDLDMICAIAELESDRQLLAMRYNKKTKDTTMGIMQMLPKTAQWLASEMGYCEYEIGESTMLYRPFVSVYFGAAYLKWLSTFDGKERSEEFVVRAYRFGTKKATHKSTMAYWQRYVSVKQNLPSTRKMFQNHSSEPATSALASAPPAPASAPPSPAPAPAPSPAPVLKMEGNAWKYWDSRAFPDDMEALWKHPDVLKEWIKSGERRGKVRFSLDAEKRPYLSRLEVKAVAEIIISKYFDGRGFRPTALGALAEVSSMRFVNGVGACTGIMGVDYHKALWLYKELSYKAYKVDCVDHLYNPFASMYFAAAYLVWLSEYEGRERSPQFVIQAYLGGPDNVDVQETGQIWAKFAETLSFYEDPKKGTRELLNFVSLLNTDSFRETHIPFTNELVVKDRQTDAKMVFFK